MSEERIILNSTILNETKITLSSKPQKNNFFNFYFSPNMAIKLYNPRVSWIDECYPHKHISFSFNKTLNMSLLNLLKHINTRLTNEYNTMSKVENNSLGSIYFEKDDTFYIKCYMPNFKARYSIKYMDKEDKPLDEYFKIPRVGCIYDAIVLDIRNIWKGNNKSGFNLELKQVYCNF